MPAAAIHVSKTQKTDRTDLCLRASTVILLRETRVGLFGPRVRIAIDLDFPPVPPPPIRLPLPVAALAALLRVYDAGTLADLSHQLEQAELVEPWSPVGEIPPPWGPDRLISPNQPIVVITLGELLSRRASGRDITRVLAVTADTALWTGEDPDLASVAVGLFVARMPRWTHRLAYGAALTEPATTAHGDLPRLGDLEWAVAVLEACGPPVTLDLTRHRVSGRLDGSRSPFDPDSGLLAVAGPLGSVVVGTGAGSVTCVSAIAGEPPDLNDPFRHRPAAPTFVGAADPDPGLAATKCMSEACEFLICNAGIPADAVHRCADDLDADWLSPTDVVSYQEAHRDRLAVTVFDPGEPQWWVPGTRAGARVWLPAALVHGRAPSLPGWFHPTAVSSSGVAAHPVWEQAVRSAWLESVERDAFQRSRVLAGGAPPDVARLSSIPASEQPILKTLTSRADVLVMVLPSPTGCPVVLVRTDTPERIGLGCAAAHRPADALRHALVEAVSQALSPAPAIDDPAEVRTPLDHAGLYTPATWRSRLDWMFSGRRIDFDEIPAAPVERLPNRAAVYTFPRSIPLVTHVVRVIDPGLIPITFGHDTDPDGRPDFAELACRAGHDLLVPIEPHPLA